MHLNIISFDTIDSTNTEALKQARLGADEGLCVVARQQTAGRGRHGRTWVSPEDAGLYFSIVLRPKLDARDLSLITLTAGVAVYDSLADLGLRPDIKWVNDVLVDEKKICGILAETTDTPSGLAVIVGIGINLRSTNFPTEIAATATSIEESGASFNSTEELTANLTKHFSYFYAMLSKEPSSIIDDWSRRSSYFRGKHVRAVLENETVLGVTDGLGSNGALRIRRDDGSIAMIQAGDVERLRTAT
jgi:BirA family biotin operon repressor/biotin-[acetyl-CoA-carboxylase] ligase